VSALAAATFEARLKAQALGLGFDLAGITTLGPVDTHDKFAAWLESGRHGTMEYLARGTHLRADTTRPEPGMRSALVVALDYGGKSPDGPVARYARGDDYHRVMWDRLEELLAWVRAERGEATRGRAYVDTGPILERDLARKAGLGWFGKNTMLINPERGSFFFLGALFLDLELAADAPFAEDHCGTCTRCLDACPTHALVAPSEMDATKCISYLTIEHRGEFSERDEALIGEHLYGCDICQDVCPWNVKFAQELKEPAFAARPTLAARDAAELAQVWLSMDEPTYRQTFKDSAMKRAKLDGLKRNARAVLRNLLLLTAFIASSAEAQGVPPADSTKRDSTRRIAPMVIGATRSPRRVEDEPVRVEVLGKEEVEEKLLMTPGDITMMLNETSGLRVQTTSQALGAANLRIQGLRGRYTQILVDGLPLAGGQTGGLGLLQIPPMDLGGVEIVKGVSSALYGGSALGGVINLVSRRADDGTEHDRLINRTSLGGADAVNFNAGRLSENWDGTLLVGLHSQRRIDRDDDGWSDLAGYERQVIRPRLFWSNAAGHSAMITTGLTWESRYGGTDFGEVAPDGFASPQFSKTQRYDAGFVGRWPVGNVAFGARASGVSQSHNHRFDAVDFEQDIHRTFLGEVSATGFAGGSTWVIGAAYQQEHYENDDVFGFDYTHGIPGVFVQATSDFTPTLAMTLSSRWDVHSRYGAQISPRLSALWKFTDGWSLRASGGRGYFAPSALTEEVEVVGLSRLEFINGGLSAEQASSGSLDLGGAIGGIEFFATLFASRIESPVSTRESPTDSTRVEVFNAIGDVRTRGGELMLRARPGPMHLSLSYTRLRSTEPDPESLARREVPLTPNSTIGALIAYEQEDVLRAGLEIYYTGPQSIPDDPDRTHSPAYTHIGAMIERRFGAFRVFVNGENLLDVRQTKTAPLTLPERGLGGRWTRDVWGPVDGRVFNIGVRF
jgi:outer membrane receptor for ferrienterochelin and colicins